ncbi:MULTISPECIES: VirK family protein [unclassified Sinorhizobium]|uniref:VirK family protein n=1 Tax=unclassified Sinorhizobium TaxID=2613772 RepID=UPI0035267FB5
MMRYQDLLGTAVIAGLSMAAGPSGAKAEDEPTKTPSFDELLNALLGGNDVTVTVDLAQCTGGNPASPGMRIEGGFHIKSFIVPDRKLVAFSDVHSTIDKQGKPLTEYLQYRVSPDGKTDIRHTTTTTDPWSIISTYNYACEIGKGVNFVWR